MVRAKKESGFTYLALLAFVAISGAGLAAMGMLWSTAQQREKENDLLFVGNEFRSAIASYYQRTPGTMKRYPSRLEDLVADNRQLATVRHLRKIYADPITVKREWGVVRAPDGGVMGVYSLATDQPIKRGNFHYVDRFFNYARKYSDWKFIYDVNAQ